MAKEVKIMPTEQEMFDESNKNLDALLKGFKVLFFDNEYNDKTGNITLKKSGEDPVEIDAIAIKDNIILLINVYSGCRKDEIKRKISPFFRNLKYLDDPLEGITFEIANQTTPKGKTSTANIAEINEWISRTKKEFKIICRKVMFCPNLKVYGEDIGILEESEQVVDETQHNIFKYILENIGEFYLENELFYFLKIRMVEINRRRGATSIPRPQPAKSYECVTTKLEVGTGKEMYSICTSVSEIIKFVHVFRSADYYNAKAFQRMVNGDRLRRISNKYLNSHSAFPNNIILALNPKYYRTDNKQEFHPNDNTTNLLGEYGSLIIIDGQHRLLAHLINPDRDIDKKVLLNLIFFPIKSNAYNEMREMFYVINTEQKKLSSATALKILSIKEPNALVSIFYRIFDELNKDRNSYLLDKIEFLEKELRTSADKLHISSVVRYGGLAQIVKGKGKRILGLTSINEDKISDPYPFYKNIIRRYFDIIGETIPGTLKLTPLQIGGLLRLIRQFLNDGRTKQLIVGLSKTTSGETPQSTKDGLKTYLSYIPFDRLDEISYSANDWSKMEGFFVGCIRQRIRRFGNATVLKGDAKKAVEDGKQF